MSAPVLDSAAWAVLVALSDGLVLLRIGDNWAFVRPAQEPTSSDVPEGVISFLVRERFVREVGGDKLEITSDSTSAYSAAEQALAREALVPGINDE
jgi:hypothetical protein